MPVAFRILGEAEMLIDGEQKDIGHSRQRNVLIALLAEANHAVTVEQMVERVWGEGAPHRSVSTLYTYVSRLRRTLAGVDEIAIAKQGGGYVLRVDPMCVDLHVFQSLVAKAAVSDEVSRFALLDQALALWRGPMPDDPDTTWFVELREHAHRQRWTATLDRTDLALRGHGQAVSLPELTMQVQKHPMDERLAGQFMVALDQSGNRGHALQHYVQIRGRLADELGVDPSPALQAIHQTILTREVEHSVTRPISTAAVPTAVTARMLPAPPRSFTGREDQVRQLLRDVTPDHHGTDDVSPSGICAIDGMAGIGKTALALHVAHRVAHQFPDGQFFLDLQAHTPGQLPLDHEDALSLLLTAAGVNPSTIPVDLAARFALWRNITAKKAVLIILDNAVDHDHVRPFLPDSSQSLILITSRRRLEAIQDTESLSLSVLSPTEAQELFVRVSRTGEQRPELIEVLTELCGRLPLAITLLAGRLRHHQSWTLQYLVDKVTNTRDRLTELRAENLSVATAFDLSYQNLSADLQRLFRLLGNHPGPDLDVHAASALSGCKVATITEQLDALYTHHLIEEPTPGRYRCHDLVRSYARARAISDDTTEDRDRSLARLTAYYLHTCVAANLHLPQSLTPLPVPVNPANLATRTFTDAPDAYRWLEADFPNAAACVTHTSVRNNVRDTIALSGAVFPYLRLRGFWHLALTVNQSALAAARAAQDRHGEALVLSRLGHSQVLTDDYPSATQSFLQAHEIFVRIEDLTGQAVALHHLGSMRYLTDDVQGSAEILNQAHRLYSQISDLRGMTQTLVDLGQVQYLTGAYEAALKTLESAYEMSVRLRDRGCQSAALNNLGQVNYLIGQRTLAAEQLAQAYAISLNLGDLIGQAQILVDIGQIHYSEGKFDEALATLNAARKIFIELNNRLGHAHSLYHIGKIQHQLGKLTTARANLNQSHAFYSQLGNNVGITEASNELREILFSEKTVHKSIDYHREALHLAQRCGLRAEEARALQGISKFLIAQGKRKEAEEILGRAHIIRMSLEITKSDIS
ncbi:BTAD domain-containing putative transcriptional regulator [Amycolatopsis sp. NPDC004079]|uniref:BTAD domain-containing putative transcriptional regulator n=1 Tax=Amycolatopsis sp. NPDC004079 TaxID=3154549 RepID=UPI0033A6C410